MTRRALLANLGFEYELSGRDVPRPAALQAERFSHILRLVPGFRDAEPFSDVENPADVVAWGFSPAARRRVSSAITARWPSAEIVRRANDKRTSHELENELGVAPPGATLVDSVDAVESAAEQLGGAWLVKHPFGVAGRGQAIGENHRLDHRLRATVRRLLEDAGSLVFEPRVAIDREYSTHFDVDRGGVKYVGAAELLTHRGTFRGNKVPFEPPAHSLRCARLAVESLADLGWSGPVGIDAFEGDYLGEAVVRPISEINARWTFGRLALELRDEIGAGSLRWHHAGRGVESPTDHPVPPGAPRGEWRLPEWCDPAGNSGTWLQIDDETR